MSNIIDGGGNPNSFPDIHAQMDGKLKYPIRTKFPVEEKQKIIGGLLNVINERGNPEIKNFGLFGIQLIQRDAGNNRNYLAADNILADDILVEICIIITQINDQEIINTAINHICEQMSDMLRTNGTCPSGRCRVIQVYMFLKDYIDGKHLPSS